jgi:hypothetical protein
MISNVDNEKRTFFTIHKIQSSYFCLSRGKIHSCLCLHKTILQCNKRTINVITVGVSNADTHVAKADVLGSNLLVQTASKDNTTLHELGQNIRRSQTLGKVDGSHPVGLVLGLRGQLLETEVSDGLLDLLRCFAVSSEAVGQWD